MASWCADNLRDAQAWRSEGLTLSVSSDEAARMFDAAVRQLVSWTDCAQLGGLEDTMGRIKEAEPQFLMGRVFSLGVNAMGTGRSLRTDAEYGRELAQLVADAQKSGNPREKGHARAVQLFASGEMQSACVEWEKILAEHPNDLLALKFSNDAYFFTGDPLGKRDNVARVLPKWDKRAPCYSYLHGMYAFGLEECGQYAEAAQQARHALLLNRNDCWATHALAHCYEMVSNYGEGIAFLESTEADWAPGNFIASHNYWHIGLFHMEKGDCESALSVYDKEVLERTLHCKTVQGLTDAASMLARLELEGVQVGRERWEALLSLAQKHAGDQLLCFNDAHIAWVLSRLESAEDASGETKAMMRQLTENIDQFVKTGTGDNARIARDLGQAVCSSVAAFNAEDYANSFDSLYPLRTQLYRMAGSWAQRDLFTQMLIHAGLRCEDATRHRRAIEVIEERSKMWPNSELPERLLKRHRETGHAPLTG